MPYVFAFYNAGDQKQWRRLPPINVTTDIVPVTPRNLNVTLDELTKIAIQHALAQHRGNREKAAKQLGIGARTLYRKLKEYGIS